MRSESMPQGVWMNIRRQAFRHSNFLYDSPDTARRKPSAALVDQQRICVFIACSEQFLSRWHVFRQCNPDRVAKRHVPFFLAFASNKDSLGTEPDIINIDSHQFRISYSAAIQQFEHDLVTFGKCRHLGHLSIEDAVHFFDGWNAWQFRR